MEPAAHDPTLPAVCYMLAETNQLMYGWLSGGTKTVHEVAQAAGDGTNALTNHLGRPWLAFYNQEPGLGTQGVYIARAQTPQPLSADDWDVYLLQAGNLGSDKVVFEVIGGRLAVAYTEFVQVNEYVLHYLYAQVDDPTEAADWTDCVIDTFTSASDSADQLDIIEWQGLPLVARQGQEEGYLCQAMSLMPADSSAWTSYEIPLEGVVVNRAQGLELNIDGGQLYVTSLEGNAEGDGRLLVSRPQAWPPGPLDWHATQIFDSFDEIFGGLSVLFDAGRPMIAWSSDREDYPVIGFPAVAAEEELTWNLSQWASTEPPVDAKYTRAVQEVSLRLIDGDLALLYAGRYSDGGTKIDLLYSQLKPGT
jgi:hypothetical protein